jgi:hypothetical protein
MDAFATILPQKDPEHGISSVALMLLILEGKRIPQALSYEIKMKDKDINPKT